MSQLDDLLAEVESTPTVSPVVAATPPPPAIDATGSLDDLLAEAEGRASVSPAPASPPKLPAAAQGVAPVAPGIQPGTLPRPSAGEAIPQAQPKPGIGTNLYRAFARGGSSFVTAMQRGGAAANELLGAITPGDYYERNADTWNKWAQEFQAETAKNFPAIRPEMNDALRARIAEIEAKGLPPEQSQREIGRAVSNAMWRQRPIMRGAEVITEGVPAYLGAIAAALLTRGASLAAGATTTVAAAQASTAAGAFLGAQQGFSTYGEARDAGAGRVKSLLVGAGDGVLSAYLEKVPFEKFIGNAGRAALQRIKSGAVVEGVQEVTQQFASNAIARFGFDEGRKLHDGFIEALVGGAGLGAVGGAVFSDPNTLTPQEFEAARRVGVSDATMDALAATSNPKASLPAIMAMAESGIPNEVLQRVIAEPDKRESIIDEWGAGVDAGTEQAMEPAAEVQGPVPARATPDDRIEVLRAEISARTGQALPSTQFEVAELPESREAEAKVADRIGRVFKKSIVFYRNNDPRNVRGIQGMASDDAIFVDIDAKDPIQTVVLHEITHRMQREAPDLYAQLLSVAKEEGGAFEKYRAQVLAAYTKSGVSPVAGEDWIWDEFVADTVGMAGQQESFWRDLYARSPEVVQKLVDVIQRIVNDLGGVAGWRRSDMGQFYNDIQRVLDTASRVMGEYAQRQQATPPAQAAPADTAPGAGVSGLPSATTVAGLPPASPTSGAPPLTAGESAGVQTGGSYPPQAGSTPAPATQSSTYAGAVAGPSIATPAESAEAQTPAPAPATTATVGPAEGAGAAPAESSDQAPPPGATPVPAAEPAKGGVPVQSEPEKGGQYGETQGRRKTLLNEQGAAEATSEAAPAEKKKGTAPASYAFGTGKTNVIDFVSEQGGIRSKGETVRRAESVRGTGAARTAGEYDAMLTMGELGSFYPVLVSDNGQPIDVVAQQAFDAGLIADPSPDTLLEAIRTEARNYEAQGKTDTAGQDYELDQTMRRIQSDVERGYALPPREVLMANLTTRKAKRDMREFIDKYDGYGRTRENPARFNDVLTYRDKGAWWAKTTDMNRWNKLKDDQHADLIAKIEAALPGIMEEEVAGQIESGESPFSIDRDIGNDLRSAFGKAKPDPTFRFFDRIVAGEAGAMPDATMEFIQGENKRDSKPIATSVENGRAWVRSIENVEEAERQLRANESDLPQDEQAAAAVHIADIRREMALWMKDPYARVEATNRLNDWLRFVAEKYAVDAGRTVNIHRTYTSNFTSAQFIEQQTLELMAKANRGAMRRKGEPAKAGVKAGEGIVNDTREAIDKAWQEGFAKGSKELTQTQAALNDLQARYAAINKMARKGMEAWAGGKLTRAQYDAIDAAIAEQQAEGLEGRAADLAGDVALLSVERDQPARPLTSDEISRAALRSAKWLNKRRKSGEKMDYATWLDAMNTAYPGYSEAYTNPDEVYRAAESYVGIVANAAMSGASVKQTANANNPTKRRIRKTEGVTLEEWAQAAGLTDATGEAAIANVREASKPGPSPLEQAGKRLGLTDATGEAAIARLKSWWQQNMDGRFELQRWAEERGITGEAYAKLQEQWQKLRDTNADAGQLFRWAAETANIPNGNDLLAASEWKTVAASRIADNIPGVVTGAMRELQMDLAKIAADHFAGRLNSGQTLIEKIVGRLNLPTADAAKLADAIMADWNARIEAKARAMLEQRFAERPVVERTKVKGTVERLLEDIRLGALDDATFTSRVQEAYGLPAVTPEMRAKFKEFAERYKKAKDAGDERAQQEAAADTINYISTNIKRGWAEIGTSWMYFSMLSGPVTFGIVNTASTYFSTRNQMVLRAEQQIAQAVSAMVKATKAKVTGDAATAAKQSTAALDAIRTLKRMAGAFNLGGNLGLAEAWRTLTTGYDPMRMGDKYGAQTVKPGEVGKANVFETHPILKKTPIKYLWRFMAATDVLLSMSAEEMQFATLAAYVAQKEGLSGIDLARRVDDMLGYSKMDAHREKAAEMGLKGQAASLWAWDQVRRNRPLELREKAVSFAKRASYTGDTPRYAAGIIARGGGHIQKHIPQIRPFLPFLDTIANVFNDMLDHSPWGAVRAMRGQYKDSTGKLQDYDTAGRERLDTWTKSFNGTTLMITLYVMAKAAREAWEQQDEETKAKTRPWIWFNGAGERDPEKKRAQLQAGMPPYSFGFGNGPAINYALASPVAIPMLTVASLLKYEEDIRNAESDLDDSTTTATERRMAAAFHLAISIMTFAKETGPAMGIKQLFDGIDSSKSDAQLASTWKKILSTVSVNLAIPNFFRQIERMFDPQVYKNADNAYADIVLRNIPFVRGNTDMLLPSLNLFGDPIESYPTDRVVKPQTGDPEFRWLAMNNMRIDAPIDRKLYDPQTDREVSMTEMERYHMMKAFGPMFRRLLAENIPWLNRIESPEEKRSEVMKLRKIAADEAEIQVQAKRLSSS